MNESFHYSDIDCRFGVIGIIWKEIPTLKVQRIILQDPNARAQNVFLKHRKLVHQKIKNLMDIIATFLQGETVNFNNDLLELDLCSEFQKKVLLAEYGIPRGSVSTYSRIAKFIGSPKAARAVGNALANNPFSIVIPCHRAVRSDGSLGGYQGGLVMKRELLEMEGVKIMNNRVDLKKITY